jgi:hypothetical protein
MRLRSGEQDEVTIFQEDALIRLAIFFLSHEPVPDPVYKAPILYLPLVLPFNPHSQASR